MTWSAQTEPDADITRKRAHYPSGHAEQAHLAVLLVKEEAVLFFSEFLGPPARAEDHTETAFAVQRQGSRIDSGITESLARRGQSQWQDAGNGLSLTFFFPGKLGKNANPPRALDGGLA